MLKGITGAQLSKYNFRKSFKMSHPSFKAVSKKTFLNIGNVKKESSKEDVKQANYTLNRVKKMKEMKKNLNRSNIQEDNPKEDMYTFKIEPGCYSEIVKKFKESGVGDEINDESAGTETPVGVKMKLVAVQGMEEEKGARVQSMLTWDVTDIRSQEKETIQQFLYHTKQTIMLQGGKHMGKIR